MQEIKKTKMVLKNNNVTSQLKQMSYLELHVRWEGDIGWREALGISRWHYVHPALQHALGRIATHAITPRGNKIRNGFAPQ